jgi:hypothetical protein
MIVTLEMFTEAIAIAQKGQKIIQAIGAAKTDEEIAKAATDAIAFTKEARVKLREEIEGPAITDEQAAGAIANIKKGMEGYLYVPDNTRKEPTT